MKHVVLDMTKESDWPSNYKRLEESKLAPGDYLSISYFSHTSKTATHFQQLWLLALVYWYMTGFTQEQNENAATKLLDDLFKKYESPEQLESELKKEFNVTVTKEFVDPDRTFWGAAGMQGLAKAYASDEPDISGITLLEPNPDYKPWKPAK